MELLVGKSLFLELPLWRMHGFDKQANGALSLTMFDLARERKASGRNFDPALWRCVGPVRDASSLMEMRNVYLGSAVTWESIDRLRPQPQPQPWPQSLPQAKDTVSSR